MRNLLTLAMIAIGTQAISQGFNPIRDLDSDVAKPYVFSKVRVVFIML